jgi:hypothetical protein
MRLLRERANELAATRGDGQVLDHLGGTGEQGVATVLDEAVGDGDREMRLAGAEGPEQDQAPALAIRGRSYRLRDLEQAVTRQSN